MSYDITETKEAAEGIVKLVSFIIKRSKDGIGVDDAMALVQQLLFDDEFKSVLVAAVKGADKIPTELRDISLEEAVQLLGHIAMVIKSEL